MIVKTQQKYVNNFVEFLFYKFSKTIDFFHDLCYTIFVGYSIGRCLI